MGHAGYNCHFVTYDKKCLCCSMDHPNCQMSQNGYWLVLLFAERKNTCLNLIKILLFIRLCSSLLFCINKG